jgi:hypothetical protein
VQIYNSQLEAKGDDEVEYDYPSSEKMRHFCIRMLPDLRDVIEGMGNDSIELKDIFKEVMNELKRP